MPASITLAHLTFSAPDGRALFSELDLSFAPIRTGLVGRNGVGKSTLLRLINGDLTPHAGRVVVNGTVGILDQTVQIDPDLTIADAFGCRAALDILDRAERGEAGADDVAMADWTLPGRLAAALGRVKLDVEAGTRLSTLSGGQATRARMAALVFAAPDFLLLDEPTNNLDRDGRSALADIISDWRGGAVVVSHDRALLDTMDAIVELTSLGATRYGGGWSVYREQKARDLAAARKDLGDAEKQVADIDRRAQQAAERQARKDGAGQRRRAKGDMPRILAGARKDRSEDTGGEASRLAERRREQAREVAETARSRIEVLQPLSVSLPPTGLPAGRSVLTIDDASVGYTPGRPVIAHLSMSITGPERIAIVGPNGSGKTTCLSLITGQLEPWAGTVRRHTSFAMFDQQVSLLDRSASIRDNFRRLNPAADENACRSALARFMFRADAALQRVGSLSGGQLLRAGLACVLGGASPPPFVILDEPTNHLDIESIEAVEAGLNGYDGALLVVSHDDSFLQAIGTSRRLTLA